MWVAFSLLRVTAYHCSLFPPTNDNHDQEWSKFWQANIGVFGKKILMLFFVSAGRPPFDELPYIVTPEGKILGQSGAICKYICKKGGDVWTRVVHQYTD